jgi:putative sterol carrier protein
MLPTPRVTYRRLPTRAGGAEKENRSTMPYPFLSDEWIDEARRIRAEYRGQAEPTAFPVRMNLVVTELPFGDGTLDAHLDTSAGELEIDKGHLDEADLKVTVDYDTAKAILVDGNAGAGMQAFMAGKVRVEGDMTKLMALQSGPIDNAQEMAARLRAITE